MRTDQKKIARYILIANDDGINAPGLACLEKIATQLGEQIWIVAPETEQSGSSRALSLHQPLRIRKLGDKKFAVNGTPADCVAVGARHIMPNKPDIILSGVNYGRNVADDITYSGTIAAAMEGTNLDIPSIALSQACEFDKKSIFWETAHNFAPDIIRNVFQSGIKQNTFVNVNFPHCKPEHVRGVAIVKQGKRKQNLLTVHERIDAMGRHYYWLGYQKEDGEIKPDTDMHALAQNHIAITPLHLDLTYQSAIQKLKKSIKT